MNQPLVLSQSNHSQTGNGQDDGVDPHMKVEHIGFGQIWRGFKSKILRDL